MKSFFLPLVLLALISLACFGATNPVEDSSAAPEPEPSSGSAASNKTDKATTESPKSTYESPKSTSESPKSTTEAPKSTTKHTTAKSTAKASTTAAPSASTTKAPSAEPESLAVKDRGGKAIDLNGTDYKHGEAAPEPEPESHNATKGDDKIKGKVEETVTAKNATIVKSEKGPEMSAKLTAGGANGTTPAGNTTTAAPKTGGAGKIELSFFSGVITIFLTSILAKNVC